MSRRIKSESDKLDIEIAEDIIREVTLTYETFKNYDIDFGLEEFQKTAREKFNYAMNSEEEFFMLPESYISKIQEYIYIRMKKEFYRFYQEYKTPNGTTIMEEN